MKVRSFGATALYVTRTRSSPQSRQPEPQKGFELLNLSLPSGLFLCLQFVVVQAWGLSRKLC